jgi:hypothetical protein
VLCFALGQALRPVLDGRTATSPFEGRPRFRIRPPHLRTSSRGYDCPFPFGFALISHRAEQIEKGRELRQVRLQVRRSCVVIHRPHQDRSPSSVGRSLRRRQSSCRSPRSLTPSSVEFALGIGRANWNQDHQAYAEAPHRPRASGCARLQPVHSRPAPLSRAKFGECSRRRASEHADIVSPRLHPYHHPSATGGGKSSRVVLPLWGRAGITENKPIV